MARLPSAVDARGLDRRKQGWLAILLLWAIAGLPGIVARSFIWEEGTNAELARRALEHGEFLLPRLYGLPWTEKPSLLAWLIAAAAAVTGQVDEISARLPSLLAGIALASLVYWLALRRLRPGAALFAALALLACPLVMQKLAIAEPDLVIALLSFGAFLLWWGGAEKGPVSKSRWLAVSLVLAILVMAKGPQPAAFFLLCAGAWSLARRRWRDLAGLTLSLIPPAALMLVWAMHVYKPGVEAQWLFYMRLSQLPPASDYLGAQLRFLVMLWLEALPISAMLALVHWRGLQQGAEAPFIQALALYALPCTLVLLFWPGSSARYDLPALPALALLAGYAWEHGAGWLGRWARRAASGIIACLFGIQIVLVTIAMPIYADRFGASRTDGLAMEAIVAADPAPVYAAGQNTNQLFYFRRPIQALDDMRRRALAPPAWLVASGIELAEFRQARPDLQFSIMLRTRSGPGLMLIRLGP